ncbi:putative F-box protein At2g02030 [Papaver somniferum]|uniref:putative F-box protein At2g02030 n=1 Tax=Papaver somniferum TaxID=3469 RepID=UPI000E6F60F8|nr:putative F-box protein At2g02030 [Papaver somniferum]
MKSMENKRQKQIITQPETQMISKKKKVGNGGDSEEISNSISLPHDLVINDILTRVPVDSLMRFNCVCKLWLNLISNDAKFMNMHARKSGTHGFGLMYLSSSYTDDDSRVGRKIHEFNGVIKSNGIVFCNIDKKENKVIHFKPETGFVNRKLVIRHSLNGLVLLSRQEDTFGFTIHVFNPITGYSVQLPDLIGFSNGIIGKRYHLAYDAATEKYKVVCFYKRKRGFIFKIVTVDVKSDSWRNVVDLSSPCLLDDYEAVFANGSLNWLTHDRYDMGGCKADQGKTLSLDVSEEKFYKIDYPKGVPDKSHLLEMGGSLCFLAYVRPGK